MKKHFSFLALLTVLALISVVATVRAEAPLTAAHLSMTVTQSGVPQKPGSPGKVSSLSINLRKIGACDGKVSLKIYFLGKDLETNKVVANVPTTKEAEAVAGAGNTYTENSAPFIVVPGKKSGKGKKAVSSPDTGSKPFGWVVQVYQNGRLVTAAGSSAGFEKWITSGSP